MKSNQPNEPSPGFYSTNGALRADAPSYIVRAADTQLREALHRSELCYILTPRQMGKTSLTVSTASILKASGDFLSVRIDLTSIGSTGVSPDQWYLGQIHDIAQQLRLSIDYLRWWRERDAFGAVKRFTTFLSEVVVSLVPVRVVIFVDEIDSTLNLPFSDDYFAAIRALIQARTVNEDLRRLTFVLLGVASPSDLIKDAERTPFNIGRRIELTDFTLNDARPLANGLAPTTVAAAELLERIYAWTNGHPYLTQRLCGRVAEWAQQEWNPSCSPSVVDALVEELFFDRAALRLDDNLSFVHGAVTRDAKREHLLRLYQQIRNGKDTPSDRETMSIVSSLKLSGLVKAKHVDSLMVRNRIYERVFNDSWLRAEMAVRVALHSLPAPRNSFFMGRDELFECLDSELAKVGRATIVGSPGVGKTESALEYAYRRSTEYKAIFWMSASTRITVSSGLVAIARILGLPEHMEAVQAKTILAVRRWFEANSGWLIIVDDVDEYGWLEQLLPRGSMGHILAVHSRPRLDDCDPTSQFHMVALPAPQGAELLLKQTAGKETRNALQEDAAGTLSERLANLPLALSQAAAYVIEMAISLTEYYRVLERSRSLVKRTSWIESYEEAVTMTVQLSLSEVSKHGASADLMRASAFLGSQPVPVSLVTRGANSLGPKIAQALHNDRDEFPIDRVFDPLDRFALISRSTSLQTYHVHSGVQTVVREMMNESTCRMWVERLLAALDSVFPKLESARWDEIEHLLPHVEKVIGWTDQFAIFSDVKARLLNKAAGYLNQRQRVSEAQRFVEGLHETVRFLRGS